MNPHIIRTGIAELLPMARSGDPARHVSAIIRSLCLRLGHFGDTGPITDFTRVELGSAFENAVAAGLARRYALADSRYVVPGELELDGLIGTPDLLDTVDLRVIEIKLTWISSRHDAESEKFWKYWVQAKAYCHMMDWREAELHIGHISGNYKDQRSPIYNVWHDTFSNKELNENWRMLISHGEQLRERRPITDRNR